METGRPCGVILHQFAGLACAMSIDQCEVPPCYCGETEQSAATVTLTSTNPPVITATLTDSPVAMIRPGDLIQFNCQGPYYSILGSPQNQVDPTTGFTIGSTLQVTVADASQNSLVPWPPPPQWSLPVPYRIFRRR